MTTSKLLPTPRASDADKGGRGELLSVVRTGHKRAAPSATDQLTLFAEGSLVRMSAPLDSEKASMEPDRDYGSSTPDLLASYDPATSLWRTSQACLLEEWATYSGSWPRSGMMRNGMVYRLPPLVPLTDVTASGSWATPQAHDAGKGNPQRVGRYGTKHGGRNLNDEVALYPTPSATSYGSNQGGAMGRTGPVRHSLDSMARTGMWPTPTSRDFRSGKASPETMARNARPLSETIGGTLNPTWVEWLMGWPLGWTALEPLETDRYQQWLRSHGGS